MARAELARRLEELNMSQREAKGYSSLLAAVDSHIARLHDLLESEWACVFFFSWEENVTHGLF